VQTNGARSGGPMVVSWTLFRAASQESGLSGLETGARPDEALAHFETGSVRNAELTHRRLFAGYSRQGWSECPGDDVARFGFVAMRRAVGGVGRSVVGVDADPHAVAPLTAGEVHKARGEGQPDALLSSVFGDG
jgi:hypothetical protein